MSCCPRNNVRPSGAATPRWWTYSKRIRLTGCSKNTTPDGERAIVRRIDEATIDEWRLRTGPQRAKREARYYASGLTSDRRIGPSLSVCLDIGLEAFDRVEDFVYELRLVFAVGGDAIHLLTDGGHSVDRVIDKRAHFFGG